MLWEASQFRGSDAVYVHGAMYLANTAGAWYAAPTADQCLRRSIYVARFLGHRPQSGQEACLEGEPHRPHGMPLRSYKNR